MPVFSLNYDFHVANGDNGNVFAITNNKDTTRNQTFTYDALNRLTSAQNAGTDCTQSVLGGNLKFWGNNYTYDAWGNLTNKTKIQTACAGENLNAPATANNQLVGYSYDAAGNMTSDPTDSVTATYDPENRITTATKNGVATTYTYDVEGNRVEKSNGTTGTLYWYMALGIVAESDLSGNLQSEYVFFNGERVARKNVPGLAVSYYFSDHLNTTDIVTDAQGNINNESDYYPWGGELQFVANDSNHYKFTGKERDSETGLDYFGARYYSNGLGRFVSADWSAAPVPVPYANLADPQSLNLYRYPSNPESFADIDGHQQGDVVGTASDRIMKHPCDLGIGPDTLCVGRRQRAEEESEHQFEQALADYAKTCQSGACQLGRKAHALNAKIDAFLAPAYKVLENVLSLLDTGIKNCPPELDCKIGIVNPIELPDEAFVVRGGTNTVELITKGVGTHPSGITGVSVESAAGKSVTQLVEESPIVRPYGKIGCCRVRDVRAAGGDVIPTTGLSPNHATLTGLTPAQINQILEVMKNPIK